jgi:excisionase family DNA binding protein
VPGTERELVALGRLGTLSLGMEGEDDRALLLTVREAAALLAVGRTTLYELIADGQLGTVHIGRAVRVPRAELEAFVARRFQTVSVR